MHTDLSRYSVIDFGSGGVNNTERGSIESVIDFGSGVDNEMLLL